MFRDILKNEYETRKMANSSYSMRAMARDLNISPSFLVNLINGKRCLSENGAKKIANSLSLPFATKKQFLLSARIENSRRPEDRESLRRELKELNSETDRFRKSQPDELKKINSYLHFAILSALDLSNEPTSALALSKTFLEDLSQINDILEDLVEFKYVERNSEDMFQTCVSSTETSSEAPSTDIKKIHRSSINRALSSVDQNYQNRELSTTILSFCTEDYEEAKDMIKEFVYQFHSRFSVSENKDSIRQLSLQFVRLDEPTNGGQ